MSPARGSCISSKTVKVKPAVRLDRGPIFKPYQRDFGVPAPKAQDRFTDPQARIMKRTGGGFDYSYNAQTAVDETATEDRNARQPALA